MKGVFSSYYPPDDDALSSLWSNAEIVIDANVLLNLYIYSVATRNKYTASLKSLKSRLWIPYQVGLEYQRNRVRVLTEQFKVYDELNTAFATARSGLIRQLPHHDTHAMLDRNELEGKIKSAFAQLTEFVNRKRGDDPHLRNSTTNDLVRDELDILFAGKIGPAFDPGEIEALREEGQKRYDVLTPPGYCDREKELAYRFGDFFLWEQMLRRAESTHKPIILLTEDVKDDWWHRHDHEIVGPRPELIDEMRERANVAFYIYRPTDFFDQVAGRLGQDLDADMLSEIHYVGKRLELTSAIERLVHEKRLLEIAAINAYDDVVMSQSALGSGEESTSQLQARLFGEYSAVLDRIRAQLADVEEHLRNLRDENNQ